MKRRHDCRWFNRFKSGQKHPACMANVPSVYIRMGLTFSACINDAHQILKILSTFVIWGLYLRRIFCIILHCMFMPKLLAILLKLYFCNIDYHVDFLSLVLVDVLVKMVPEKEKKEIVNWFDLNFAYKVNQGRRKLGSRRICGKACPHNFSFVPSPLTKIFKFYCTFHHVNYLK